ncbi:MAG TPA: dinitrogenase iron-molybdenum cofactor biosynthesis protein [Gammaproteobacteria bacterium]|nr:dinitrogenase iron-molybdenum cofactor biosynthesis protein [Gammaproteobacteria bacterium]
MSENLLPREIALRIGLASREIPGVEPANILSLLNDSIGLPPTYESLNALSLKMFKSAGNGILKNKDVSMLKAALACLKGEKSSKDENLPLISPLGKADMPGSIRVAVASNHEEKLDGHFGSCRRFLVYQLSPEEIRLIDIRSTAGMKEGEEKNAYRADLISDCQVLYVSSIGGPAAAKVVKNSIHPIKQVEVVDAREVLSKLQDVISAAPPPWLAKVMGHSEQARIRFETE